MKEMDSRGGAPDEEDLRNTAAADGDFNFANFTPIESASIGTEIA